MPKSTMRSVHRVFDVLECFIHNSQAISLKEIADMTGLSTSTVYRLSVALNERGYLNRRSDKRYELGNMIAKLGYMKTGQMGIDFKVTARKYLLELQKKFNESISLYVIQDDKRLCIDRIESTHDLRRVIEVGSTFPLGVGAAGHILVAFMNQDFLDDLYLHVDLSEDLYRQIKKDGYIITQGEREVGVCAVAAPIFNFSGKVIAALSLSGPSVRLDIRRLQEIALEVKAVAAKMSKELGYYEDYKVCL